FPPHKRARDKFVSAVISAATGAAKMTALHACPDCFKEPTSVTSSTCAQGHQWQVQQANGTALQSERCPICGGAALATPPQRWSTSARLLFVGCIGLLLLAGGWWAYDRWTIYHPTTLGNFEEAARCLAFAPSG